MFHLFTLKNCLLSRSKTTSTNRFSDRQNKRSLALYIFNSEATLSSGYKLRMTKHLKSVKMCENICSFKINSSVLNSIQKLGVIITLLYITNKLANIFN